MKKLKISFEETDKQKQKYKKYPRIDTDLIAFGSEEEVEQANIDYINKIKTKVLKRFLLPTIVISLLLIVGISLYSIIQIKDANQKYYIANERAESLAKQVRDYSEDSTLQKRAKSRTEQSSDNSYSSNSTQRKCTVPDCTLNANTSSYYCVRHECMQVGCHEQKVSDICLYCETHKCDMPGCNNKKSMNSYFCLTHK